ncbi:MAG: hypothetical protein ACRELX_16335 [Longimicrobiales bacterium]
MQTVRDFLGAVAIVSFAASTTWQPVGTPVTYLESNRPERVRVVRGDGSVTVFRSPTVRVDSLFGWDEMAQAELGLALRGVRSIDAPQLDRTRTTMLIGGLALLAGGAAWAIAAASDGPKLICDNYDVSSRCYQAPQLRVSLPLRFGW